MFAQEDLSDVKEVLLWRQYARGLSTHNINAAAGRGNYRIGLTRGFVQNFLMKMVLRFMLTVLMRMVTAIIWATRRLLMYVVNRDPASQYLPERTGTEEHPF